MAPWRAGMVPLAAEALLFFACAKKSKQKKHTPAVRPPHAAGAQSRREFSCRASCPVRKRRTSLCAALDGRRFRMAQGCALRKFPTCSRTRRYAPGVPPGVCFFGSFFAQAKKERPPRRAAPCLSKRRSIPQGHRTKSPSRKWRVHREGGRYGLRCPSPQPLSRRERGSQCRESGARRQPPNRSNWFDDCAISSPLRITFTCISN
jgi:hypothetical protein